MRCIFAERLKNRDNITSFFEPSVGIVARAIIHDTGSEPWIVEFIFDLVCMSDAGIGYIFIFIGYSETIPFQVMFMAEEWIGDCVL